MQLNSWRNLVVVWESYPITTSRLSGLLVLSLVCWPERRGFYSAVMVAIWWRLNASGSCTVWCQCTLKDPSWSKWSEPFHYGVSHSFSRFDTLNPTNHTHPHCLCWWTGSTIWAVVLSRQQLCEDKLTDDFKQCQWFWTSDWLQLISWCTPLLLIYI